MVPCSCTQSPVPVSTGSVRVSATAVAHRTRSKVRFIHALPPVGAVNVYYFSNGQWTILTANLTYLEIGTAMHIGPGHRYFAITSGRDAYVIDATLVEGHAYNFVIYRAYDPRPGAPPPVLAMRAAVDCHHEGRSGIRFVHAAAGTGVVDVVERCDVVGPLVLTSMTAGDTLFAGAGYGAFIPHGPYFTVNPGTLNLLIVASGQTSNNYSSSGQAGTVVLAPGPLPLDPGGQYTLILVGGGQYPLQSFHIKDNLDSCSVGGS